MKKQILPFALALLCLCGLAFYMMLSGCARPVPKSAEEIDFEFSRSMAAGRLAFDQGLIEQAAGFYHQALRRARAMDSAPQIGDAAYNLAACWISLNLLEKARDLLEEAKTEISSIHGNIADILLVEAKLARLQGNPEEALMLADQVLASPGSYPTDNLRLQVYLLRGQVACDKDNAALALQELQKAKSIARRVSDLPLQANVSALAGRIHLIENEHILAAKEFDNEARLLRQARRYPEMTHALQNAAEMYLSAGNYSLAADRFFRAARSTFAQGQNSAAVKLGHFALSAADKAEDQSVKTRVEALLDEIETASGQ
jgi:tetratricopeptide (TPR) repeat protein